MQAPGNPIGVIGAGLAGLACARELARRGFTVTVVDKGRAPGGRTSTRRQRFDHGAARLELGAPALAAERAAWEAAGVIAPWAPVVRGAAHPATWIGVPGATALAAHLARDLDVRVEQRVVRLEGERGAWQFALDGGALLGPFSTIVLTAPTPQTRDLLATAGASAFDAALERVVFAPCIVAMVVVRGHDATDLDELHPAVGPLAQAHRMDRRPGRIVDAGTQTWVLHGREDWSAAHLEEDPEVSARELAAALVRELPAEVVEVRGHRWRYARATQRIAAPFLVDAARGIGLAGDWFEPGTRAPAASRALLSGIELAAALSIAAA